VEIGKLARYGTTLLPIHVARAVGARGLVQALPAACAAGNYAIGFALDQIRLGRADVVVTGASELLDKVQFAGFVRLGAMAPDRCQPFDKNRKGLLIGEGAAVLVLESEEHMLRRGGVPLAEVGGYGLACDAFHITRPHPEGKGSAKAMRDCIAETGVTPGEVDFINAHGTATPANDQVESRVIQEVFAGRRVPVTSIKGMLGHCMGAASALEAVACVETVLTGMYPPTIHYEEPDPECDVAVVANHFARGKADVVLNNSLAFGGYDAVVSFAKPGVLAPPGDRLRRRSP
jgi:3-oxoacyl-[acyl-carrier-protein] synthase II